MLVLIRVQFMKTKETRHLIIQREGHSQPSIKQIAAGRKNFPQTHSSLTFFWKSWCAISSWMKSTPYSFGASHFFCILKASQQTGLVILTSLENDYVSEAVQALAVPLCCKPADIPQMVKKTNRHRNIASMFSLGLLFDRF